MDPLRNADSLPADIRETAERLVVDRCGEDPQSYMITEDIIGHVAPGACYRLHSDGLIPWEGEAPTPEPVVPDLNSPPPHLKLSGQWRRAEDVPSAKANILGGLGTLSVDHPTLIIPEAPSTRAALAYYGARLIAVGDPIIFDGDQNMPVTLMNIGPAYVPGYLHVEGQGGGAFVEYHDRPHLHMPLEPSAEGHILLGRSDGDDYWFSGFRIPFGFAIYTPPYALHADPYLIGRYLVVYSVTPNYSTVVFQTPNGEVVETRITAV